MLIGIESYNRLLGHGFEQYHRCKLCVSIEVARTGQPVFDNGFVPRTRRLEHSQGCPNRQGSDWSDANLSDLAD